MAKESGYQVRGGDVYDTMSDEQRREHERNRRIIEEREQKEQHEIGRASYEREREEEMIKEAAQQKYEDEVRSYQPTQEQEERLDRVLDDAIIREHGGSVGALSDEQMTEKRQDEMGTDDKQIAKIVNNLMQGGVPTREVFDMLMRYASDSIPKIIEMRARNTLHKLDAGEINKDSLTNDLSIIREALKKNFDFSKTRFNTTTLVGEKSNSLSIDGLLEEMAGKIGENDIEIVRPTLNPKTIEVPVKNEFGAFKGVEKVNQTIGAKEYIAKLREVVKQQEQARHVQQGRDFRGKCG